MDKEIQLAHGLRGYFLGGNPDGGQRGVRQRRCSIIAAADHTELFRHLDAFSLGAFNHSEGGRIAHAENRRWLILLREQFVAGFAPGVRGEVAIDHMESARRQFVLLAGQADAVVEINDLRIHGTERAGDDAELAMPKFNEVRNGNAGGVREIRHETDHARQGQFVAETHHGKAAPREIFHQ